MAHRSLKIVRPVRPDSRDRLGRAHGVRVAERAGRPRRAAIRGRGARTPVRHTAPADRVGSREADAVPAAAVGSLRAPDSIAGAGWTGGLEPAPVSLEPHGILDAAHRSGLLAAVRITPTELTLGAARSRHAAERLAVALAASRAAISAHLAGLAVGATRGRRRTSTALLPVLRHEARPAAALLLVLALVTDLADAGRRCRRSAARGRRDGSRRTGSEDLHGDVAAARAHERPPDPHARRPDQRRGPVHRA